MNEKEKQSINQDNCIDIIIEKFPKSNVFFSRALKKDIHDEFDESYEPLPRKSLHGEMAEFSDYVSELLQKDTESQYIKDIFNFMEFLLAEGDDMVQNAVATCFLENILNRTPEKIQPHTFVPFLGKQSREYCKAWDSFTGVYTQGLWDDETPLKT
ncbi:MAG: hypothetical protein LLG04_16510 [Parachlamydia sp.]|nr:hypothetical protein [Parachlamydia sp.]